MTVPHYITSKILYVSTVKTEMIENLARTLELPLLVRSVSQVRGEGALCVLFPNPKLEIPDVLALSPIISVLTVYYFLNARK